MLPKFVSLLKRTIWFIKYKLAKRNARATSYQSIYRRAHTNILVLCYGNIYRSPFVKHYLKKNLINENSYNIESGGFYLKSGRHCSESYIKLVNKYGIDLSNHTSSVVTNDLLDWADHVIIMDGKNYKLCMMLNNKVSNKLIWLGSLNSGSKVEIEDPYGKSEEETISIVKEMTSSCDEYIKLINNKTE